jgi:hypothetical protein
MDRLKSNGLQDYAKSIFPSSGVPSNYDSDASKKEVQTKQASLHSAYTASKGLQDKQSRQDSRAVEEYNYFEACAEFPPISDYEISMDAACIADDCDDTESKSSSPPQDEDKEDSDSVKSGSSSFNEEPEQSPQQIRRKESKKRAGYIHPVELKEVQSKATARVLRALDSVHKSVHSNDESNRRTGTL